MAKTWQSELLRQTFSKVENRPRVIASKKVYNRKVKNETRGKTLIDWSR